MKTFTKSVLMLAVVAAFVSFASCGNAGAQKAAEDSIAAAKAADSIAQVEAAAAAAAAAVRPLLNSTAAAATNNSRPTDLQRKNSRGSRWSLLLIFIPVTLLILSYSILLFPSYLITIYISSSLIIFSASLCSSLLFTASPTVRKSPDHNKKPLPEESGDL